MRSSLVRLGFGILLVSVAGLSNSGERPATASALLEEPVSVQADQGRLDSASILLKAEYRTFRGPCYRTANGASAMPACDSFTVIEVVRGTLPVQSLDVRPMTNGGPNYPRNLEVGKVYLIEFTPTAETRKEIRTSAQEGGIGVWIAGEELQVPRRE